MNEPEPPPPQRGLLRDLTDPRWIKVKGGLFLLMGLLAGTLLLWEHPSLLDAALLLTCVWGFCRAYYFAFYVIGNYVDPGYRFSGLWSFLRYCLRRKPRG